MRIAVLALLLITTVSGCGVEDEWAKPDSPAGLPDAGSVPAHDPGPHQEELAALIERAIEAHGGETAIRSLQIGRVVLEGDGRFGPGIEGHSTVVDTFHLPRRLRREATAESNDETIRILTVLDGDKAWMKMCDGPVTRLQPSGDKLNAFPFTLLSGLLDARDGGYTLTREESDDSGRILIAMEKGELYYGTIALDKDTHYLVATTKLLPDPEKGDWAVIDTIYDEHKVVQGVVVPMRMVSYKDGDILVDVTVKKLEILESLESSDFAKPD